MRRIHLFNPENDLALALGCANYTPPPNAMKLHQAGAALPLWYGNSGDKVIMPIGEQAWVDRIKETFSIETDIFQHSDNLNDYNASPWGWSENARKQFIDTGLPTDIIADSNCIEKIRELSHRHTTIKIMSRLGGMLDFKIPSIPFEAHSIQDVKAYLHENPYCYIKLPWSSSGRGVIPSISLPTTELLRRCAGMIKRQGSVMCEAGLNKIIDFAMLFESNSYAVSHYGYSAFFTENGTAYSGNIVTDDSIIEQYLSHHIPTEHLHATASALETILTELIAPYYNGFFGIDMMVYKKNNIKLLAPCIEMNLRMTMGVVAKRLNRFIAPGSNAIFRVGHGKYPNHQMLPIMDGNRIVEGYISLIPENDDFHISMDVQQRSNIFQFGI